MVNLQEEKDKQFASELTPGTTPGIFRRKGRELEELSECLQGGEGIIKIWWQWDTFVLSLSRGCLVKDESLRNGKKGFRVKFQQRVKVHLFFFLDCLGLY